MESKTLYMKIEQCTIIRNKKIFLRDIAKMYCQEDPLLAKKAGEICVLNVNADDNAMYAFSVMKIIDLIGRQFKGVTVCNLGEIDFVIKYELPRKRSRVADYVKAAIVSLIVFFGAAFTMMTFNEDVSVGTVFEMVYKLFGAKDAMDYHVMEITYSVGLAVGIIVFFNHFSRKSAHTDPTPLQIEMRKYEKDINAAIISASSREGKTKDV